MLIGRLKSEAVKVGPDQLPELAATFAGVCADLRLQVAPELYVMQAGGMLNAFATRSPRETSSSSSPIYSKRMDQTVARSGSYLGTKSVMCAVVTF